MSNLGSLVVSLEANMASFASDMGRASQLLENFGRSAEQAASIAKKALAAVGVAATIDGMARMVDGVLASAAALDQLRRQTGASVESLSALAAVGRATGTAVDDIATAMNKLAKSTAIANEESKGAGQAIAALGINFSDFQRQRPEEKMLTLAKALDQFQDGSGKSAVAMALLGRTGAQMLPFLQDLARTGELVAKVTAEQAKQSHEYEVALTRIKASSEAWKKELAFGMLPALNDTAEAVLTLVNQTGGLRDVAKALREDGSIEAWTRNAITGITYVIDVVQGVVNGVRAVALAFIATGEDLVTTITTIYKTAAALKGGEFGKAADTMAAGLEQVRVRGLATGKTLDELWNGPLKGAQIREEMLKNQIREMAALGDQATATKRSLDGFTVGKDKTATDPYDALIKAAQEKTAEMLLDVDATGKATEADKTLAKYLADLEQGYIQLNATKEKVFLQEMGRQAFAEMRRRDAEKDRQLLQASAQALDDYTKTVSANIAKLQEEADTFNLTAVAKQRLSVQHQIEDAALSHLYKTHVDVNGQLVRELAVTPQVASVILQRMEADKKSAAALVEKIAAQKLSLQYDDELAQIRIDSTVYLDPTVKAIKLLDLEAAKRRAVIDSLKEDSAERQRLLQQYSDWYAASTDKIAADKFMSLWQSVDQVAQQTFTNIFDGGKNAFTKLRDTLKATLLDLLYQMTVRKWIFDITASVTGNGAIASGVTSSIGGSVFGSAGSAFLSKSGLGNLFGGGSSAAGPGMAGWGMDLGASASEAVGPGMAGWGADLGYGAAADAAATIEGATIANGAAGAVSTGLGAGITAGLASIPVYGWIAMAGMALYSYFGSKGGGPKNIGTFSTNSALYDGSRADATAASNVAAKDATTGIISAYNAAAKSLGLAAGKLDAAVMFSIDDKGKGDALTALATQAYLNGKLVYDRENALSGSDAYKNVGRSPEALQAAESEAAARAVLAALKATDMPSKLADYFNSLDPLQLSADQINASLVVAANAQHVWEVFGQLGSAFKKFADMSALATQGAINMAGGLEAFNAQTTSYIDNFYSADEKRRMVAGGISSQLAGSGVNFSTAQILGATREQFRALVEQFAALGDAGAPAVAALMSVNAEFASITDAAAVSATAVKAATDKLNQTIADAMAVAQGYRDQEAAFTKRAMQVAIDSLAAAVTRAQQKVTDARTALTNAYNREGGALQAVIDKNVQWAASLKAGREALYTGPNSPLSGRARLDAAGAALKGMTPDNALSLVNTYLDAYRPMSSSQLDLFRATDQAAALLKGQEDAASGAASAAQQQIDSMKSLMDSVDALDQTLTFANALQALKAAKVGAGNAQYNQAMGVPPAPGQSGYDAYEAKQQTSYWISSAADLGMGISDYGHMIFGKTIPQWAIDQYNQYQPQLAGDQALFDSLVGADGSHAGGLDKVPFDGYRAKLHRGERVQTAARARAEDAWVKSVAAGPVTSSVDARSADVERLLRPMLADIALTRDYARRTADFLETTEGRGLLVRGDAALPVYNHPV